MKKHRQFKNPLSLREFKNKVDSAMKELDLDIPYPDARESIKFLYLLRVVVHWTSEASNEKA